MENRMNIEIWYMKAEWFKNGISGIGPDLNNLTATHTLLKEIEDTGQSLETIYQEMQAEHWSPNGEARKLIESKKLHHTSMSVGDIVVRGNKKYIVAMFGFRELI
jgi:hypothetical protein